MRTEISCFEYSGKVLEKLNPGIFLNTSYQGRDNTMIIGWGGITVEWGKPIFIVLVRDSRATYELIEGSREFTVSVPLEAKLIKEIGICGTKSLKEMDKFQVCHFTKVLGRVVNVPIIGECELHFECKVIYKQTLDQSVIPEGIKKRYYDLGRANHTVYYGEIVDQYIYTKE